MVAINNKANRLQVRLGAVDISLKSDEPRLLSAFYHLYCGNSRAFIGDPHLCVHAHAKSAGRNWVVQKRFCVEANGEITYKPCPLSQLLPYLEWGINYCVATTRLELLQIHSAVVARGSSGVLLVAPSGSGKTTLSAALLSRGWNYLSDEFALIDPRTFQVLPFPKALCIKESGFKLITELGLSFAGDDHHVKGFKGPVRYVNPFLNGGVGRDAVPVRHIVFLRYVPDEAARLTPVESASAAFQLLRNSMNRGAFGAGAPQIASALADTADCWMLRSSDLHETCELLEKELV